MDQLTKNLEYACDIIISLNKITKEYQDSIVEHLTNNNSDKISLEKSKEILKTFSNEVNKLNDKYNK